MKVSHKAQHCAFDYYIFVFMFYILLLYVFPACVTGVRYIIICIDLYLMMLEGTEFHLMLLG